MPRAKKLVLENGEFVEGSGKKSMTAKKKPSKKSETARKAMEAFGVTTLADYVRTARLNLSDMEAKAPSIMSIALHLRKVGENLHGRHHWLERRRMAKEVEQCEKLADMLSGGEFRREFDQIYSAFWIYAESMLRDYGIRTSLTVEAEEEALKRAAANAVDPTLLVDPSNLGAQMPATSETTRTRDQQQPDSRSGGASPFRATALTPQERKLDEQLLHEFRCVWEMLPPPVKFQVQDRCVGCGELMKVRQNEGVLVCPFCGAEAPNLDAATPMTSYGEEVELPTTNPKRRGHFADKQTNFMAREQVTIPLHIKTVVMSRLYNLGCRSISDITYKKVAEAMKELHLKDWYDHKMKIACEITGLRPPYLDPVDEERSKRFFDAIQEPYERHKPPGRINFICYNYCSFQFYRMLDLTHLLPYFCLLKGPEKLDATEEVFEKICGDLNWEFESTKDLMERGGYEEGVEYVVPPGVLPPGDRPSVEQPKEQTTSSKPLSKPKPPAKKKPRKNETSPVKVDA